MNTETTLRHLVQAAERLGFTVRATKGNFRGGRCTVDGQPTIVLNTRHVPETRLRVLADALHDTPLETLYLKPAVRDMLHDVWTDLDLDPDAAGPPVAEPLAASSSPQAPTAPAEGSPSHD